jgi:hypothetical protein
MLENRGFSAWFKRLTPKIQFGGVTQNRQEGNQSIQNKPIFLTSTLPTLYLGQSPDRIAIATSQLQELLNENECPCSVTGKFDESTEEALKKFQKKRKLISDGVAGVITWTALRYPKLYFDVQHKSTKSRQAVIELQQRLVEEGFPIQNDRPGEYGKGTEASVRAFQEACGLKRDGVAGAMTMSVLMGLMQRGEDKHSVPSAIYISRFEIASHLQEIARLVCVVIGIQFELTRTSVNPDMQLPSLVAWVTAFGIAWLVPWLTKHFIPRQRSQKKSLLASYGPYVLLGMISTQVLDHVSNFLSS